MALRLRNGGRNKGRVILLNYGAIRDGFVKERRAVTRGGVARLKMQAAADPRNVQGHVQQARSRPVDCLITAREET